MNIAVLSHRYERDDVFKHIMVGTWNIVMLYFPITLPTRQMLPRRFLWYFSDAVLIMFAFWFSFRQGRNTDANWKRELQAHLEKNCLESVCALIKKSLQALFYFEQKDRLFSRKSEELDIPSNLQNKPNTQVPCVPKAHISFHTCTSRNLLASPTLE